VENEAEATMAPMALSAHPLEDHTHTHTLQRGGWQAGGHARHGDVEYVVIVATVSGESSTPRRRVPPRNPRTLRRCGCPGHDRIWDEMDDMALSPKSA